jgi:hypothetical protein
MNPEEQVVSINLPLPQVQQFVQMMEGIVGAFYQALDTAGAAQDQMPQDQAGAIPMAAGQKPPTAQETDILNALAGQE